MLLIFLSAPRVRLLLHILAVILSPLQVYKAGGQKHVQPLSSFYHIPDLSKSRLMA